MLNFGDCIGTRCCKAIWCYISLILIVVKTYRTPIWVKELTPVNNVIKYNIFCYKVSITLLGSQLHFLSQSHFKTFVIIFFTFSWFLIIWTIISLCITLSFLQICFALNVFLNISPASFWLLCVVWLSLLVFLEFTVS